MYYSIFKVFYYNSGEFECYFSGSILICHYDTLFFKTLCCTYGKCMDSLQYVYACDISSDCYVKTLSLTPGIYMTSPQYEYPHK